MMTPHSPRARVGGSATAAPPRRSLTSMWRESKGMAEVGAGLHAAGAPSRRTTREGDSGQLETTWTSPRHLVVRSVAAAAGGAGTRQGEVQTHGHPPLPMSVGSAVRRARAREGSARPPSRCAPRACQTRATPRSSRETSRPQAACSPSRAGCRERSRATRCAGTCSGGAAGLRRRRQRTMRRRHWRTLIASHSSPRARTRRTT
mmetsp:Transcript_11305/g.33573  ORF Transcript_11305/g.33573 Transcript_11305/m.33573 type:complete len:204 (-) Transcript_11305:966-1577(-)